MLVLITTLNSESGGTQNPQNRFGRQAFPDGKRRSFPKVPNLLQYVNTGVYFDRVKIEGKIFRESLQTDLLATAKLRLPDFIKATLKTMARIHARVFGESPGWDYPAWAVEFAFRKPSPVRAPAVSRLNQNSRRLIVIRAGIGHGRIGYDAVWHWSQKL
jgi:hypothetical protein